VGLTLPWALLGLLAAALPIIAHLVRRRDLPVVALPTLALLMRARAESRRRARVVDLLLLAVRVLIVVAAAVGLAGPYRTERLAYGDGRLATVAIVVDDSASMGVRGGARPAAPSAAGAPTPPAPWPSGETALARAVARADAAIDALPHGSEVAVVLAGAPARVLVARTAALDEARRAIRALAAAPCVRGTDLVGALALAARELAGGRHAARRLLLLSDLAAHAAAGALEPPEDVTVDVERVGVAGGSVTNVAIAEVDVAEDPADPARVSVAVEVRAWGDPGGARRLRLARDGETLAEAEVALVGGAGRAVLSAPLPREGDPRAWLVLEGGDALAADDRRGVLLRGRATLRALLVGPPGALREAGRALDVAPAAEGRLDRRSVDEDAATPADVARADVVVLAASRPPSPALARALVEHVDRGGGLLVAPTGDVDVRLLARALEGTLPVDVDGGAQAGPTVGLREGPGAARWGVDATGVRRAEASRRLALGRPAAGADVVLGWEDGAAALVIGGRGAGRVALLGTSLDESWTDLPLRPGFPALLLRAVRALGPYGPGVGATVAPGAAAELAWPPGAARLLVTTPSGAQHTLTPPAPSAGGAGTAPRFALTAEPGPYRVEVDAGGGRVRDLPRLAFVVATPSAESDLSPGDGPRARGGALEGAAAGAEGAGGEGAPATTTVRRDLAPLAWLLAGVFAVLEGALRLRLRRAPGGIASP
jgi:hypothetical protein